MKHWKGLGDKVRARILNSEERVAEKEGTVIGIIFTKIGTQVQMSPKIINEKKEILGLSLRYFAKESEFL